MNDDLAKQFERGMLFGVGRHFWNFVGVVGLVLATVGGTSDDFGQSIASLRDGSSFVTGSFQVTATFGSTTTGMKRSSKTKPESRMIITLTSFDRLYV